MISSKCLHHPLGRIVPVLLGTKLCLRGRITSLVPGFWKVMSFERPPLPPKPLTFLQHLEFSEEDLSIAQAFEETWEVWGAHGGAQVCTLGRRRDTQRLVMTMAMNGPGRRTACCRSSLGSGVSKLMRTGAWGEGKH